MIVWINGAFGAGKTTVAYELCRRLEDAFIYDPENIGYFLRKNTPKECDKEDFQDISLWRSFNFSALKLIAEEYGGTIIVPMTLVNKAYYDEIIQSLLDCGIPLRHFILCAEKSMLLKRLKKRNLGMLGREKFAVNAIDKCLNAFEHDITDTKITTDNMTVKQIAELIANESGLSLLEDNLNRFQKMLYRMKVVFKNIR